MKNFFWGVAIALPAGFALAWALKVKILDEIHIALTEIKGLLQRISGKL